jgi:hypothetical protein
MLGQRNSTPALIRTLFGFKMNSAGNPVVFAPLDYLCVANANNTIVWPPTAAMGGMQVDDVGGNTVGTVRSPSGMFTGGVINPPNAMIDPTSDPAAIGLADVTGLTAPTVNVGDSIFVNHDGGSIDGKVSAPLAQYPAGDPGSVVLSYRISINVPADIRISGAPVMHSGELVGMIWLLQPGVAGLCIRVQDLKVN